MATCKNCGRQLIVIGGKCVYCGSAVKPLQKNGIQQLNKSSDTTAVDLGLPSGIKWATCNLGAMNPWEYGGYYAWGETAEKSIYNGNTYKWGAWSPYWKYCNDVFCNIMDNKWKLEPEDDAAHVIWGGSWRMPTLEDYNELVSNCRIEWTIMNNTKGVKLVSKINSNSVFFPAAGLRMDESLINPRCGYYKSSSLYEKNSQDAYVFLFVPKEEYGQSEFKVIPNLRELGQSVRPVTF